MNKQEQRIALAEACGWTDIDLNSIYGFPPPKNKKSYYSKYLIPDYLIDLNAIYEAEKQLLINDDMIKIYLMHLSDLKKPFLWGIWNVCHASSEERAEALVKTIGKWI